MSDLAKRAALHYQMKMFECSSKFDTLLKLSLEEAHVRHEVADVEPSLAWKLFLLANVQGMWRRRQLCYSLAPTGSEAEVFLSSQAAQLVREHSKTYLDRG